MGIINLLIHSEHIDEKKYFPISYLTDMDDLALTCSDFVNALKMLTCFVKHTVSRAMAIPKMIDDQPWRHYQHNNFMHILIYSTVFGAQ